MKVKCMNSKVSKQFVLGYEKGFNEALKLSKKAIQEMEEKLEFVIG